MTVPSTAGRKVPAARPIMIIGLAAGAAVALYLAGRLHHPDYTFSLFGQANPYGLKSLLATVALGLAAVQVVLALWIYRKLPLAGSPPRPVPLAHRITGFTLLAV